MSILHGLPDVIKKYISWLEWGMPHSPLQPSLCDSANGDRFTSSAIKITIALSSYQEFCHRQHPSPRECKSSPVGLH